MHSMYSIPKRYHEYLYSLIILIVIVISSFIYTYDISYYVAKVENNRVIIYVPFTEKSFINHDTLVCLDDKDYSLRNIKFSDVIVMDDNYYYEVSFKIYADIQDEVFKIKMINNK